MKDFWKQHSLSIIASSILIFWISAYRHADTESHWGGFLGNAIADWAGVVALVLATKYMYEKNSNESNDPPPEKLQCPPWKQFIIEHSLSLFFTGTGIIWLIVYLNLDTNSKLGAIMGNIVSEWLQIIGLILLTKKFVEVRSKE